MNKKYILIPLCFLLFSIFIRIYNNKLKKKYGQNYACKDILNKTLISVYNLKGCIWNIIHIFVYFGLCVLINAKLNVFKHIIVFLIGLLWFFLAPYSNYNNNPLICNDIVYSDTNIPRRDDIIFNIIGQLLYIFIYKVYCN
jgi:hypothetical protein